MVENIEALMIAIQTLYPGKISDQQLPMMTERYRAALASLHGIQLDEAWNKIGMTWKKRTPPTPADILSAAGGLGVDTPPVRSVEQFRADMDARDRLRSEDRGNLIGAYRAKHEYGYEMARVEGWLGYLEEQVKRSANMIAQRNEQRRAGKEVTDWKAETCDIVLTEYSHDIDREKADKFTPWFSIVTVGGVDFIEIDPHTVEVWRAEAKVPGPPVKPIKRDTLRRTSLPDIERRTLSDMPADFGEDLPF